MALQKVADAHAERVAARFEIGELIERGAGWRQQHYRLLRPRPNGVARRRFSRCVQGPANFEGNGPDQRPGKLFSRLSDKVGLGDPGKERAKRLDAASLRSAAANPVDVAEREEGFFC